jgi:hypothetical protein
MKRYTFPVTLSGVGKDADEAWRDAVEQFTLDPGEPDSAEVESGSGPFDEDDAEPIAKAEAPWPNDPPWMPEDAEASIAQGWSIFSTTGGRPFEIQSVADMPDGRDPVFESDKEAWAFVKAQAAAGDPLALKAKAFLRAHSPREYEVIFGQEGTAGEADIYQCQNCDWQGEGAVPAWDVEARHRPGDVFSDRECPEGGCLVHPVEEDENPKGPGEAEGQGGLVKLTLQLDVEYRPNGVPESELRWYLDQLAKRAAGEGLMTGESEAEVEQWRAKVVPTEVATPVPGEARRGTGVSGSGP